MRYCEAPECEREASGHGPLCWAHLKRQQRGQSLSLPIAEQLSPLERLQEAGIAWLDAGDDDEEYEHAKAAFIRACESWMRSRGWSPPGVAGRVVMRRLKGRARAHRFVQLALFR